MKLNVTPDVKMQTNPQLQLAYDFVQYTDQHIFLTGKAGTGKTTFLRELRKHSPKRMIVVAPTGVAAINAGGVTIHSFFQLPFGPQIPFDPNHQASQQPSANDKFSPIKRFSREKINIIRSLDLLVIDEISMVRADVLDGIDGVLRRFRNRNKPFGGAQLLMIGDLQQLAPIVKDDEWDVLKKYYSTCFFFSSRALAQSKWVGIELTHIFRQTDQKFIQLLNRIRENNIDETILAELNKRFIRNFRPDDQDGYITLTTHNYQAQEINHTKLEELKAKTYTYQATVEGDFPEYQFPTDAALKLKKGAQVMFVKNDSSADKRYYNGKIGTITAISGKSVEVSCPGDAFAVEVEPEEWQNTRYSLNDLTQEIEEEVIGSFRQIPLKLAWAITIHKSQGLTFDKAIINARLSFAHGQVYVALSRCRSLEGLVLSTPIDMQSVKSDRTVLEFTDQLEQNQPGGQELNNARNEYQLQLLNDLFDFQPILRFANYIARLARENQSSLMGNLNEKIADIISPFKAEIVEVSDKFVVQIKHLLMQDSNAETNIQLQKRIQKGSAYFAEKLATIVRQPEDEFRFSTDNREVKKTIGSAIDRLEKELRIKEACLEGCKKGFVVKDYLLVRARASIEQPAFKTKRNRTEREAVDAVYPDFYKQLKQWRLRKSQHLEVEVARVMRQATLLEIAEKVPATPDDLKSIKGMGGKRMQQFARELLEMTIAFRREKGLDIPLGAEEMAQKAALGTKELSLYLYQHGKTIAEIAAERKMALSTIEGHLAHWVRCGELPLKGLLPDDKIDAITRFFNKNGLCPTSEARAQLGDEYSYSEIRFVLNFLESQQDKKPAER